MTAPALPCRFHTMRPTKIPTSYSSMMGAIIIIIENTSGGVTNAATIEPIKNA